MPYRSQAQRAECHALKARGEAGSWNCEEWEKETPGGRKLPKKKKKQQKAAAEALLGLMKRSKDMPPFTEQDRPRKVKEIYRALKREHPEMPAEMKARIAARQGKKGKQKQGPPYKGPLTSQKKAARIREAEDAFKAGFLMKVAELGHTPDEFCNEAIKAAGEGIVSGLGRLGGGLVRGAGEAAGGLADIVAALAPWALATGIGIPVLAGLLAGGLHSKLTSPSESDIENVRQAEILSAYRQLALEAESRAERKRRERAEYS